MQILSQQPCPQQNSRSQPWPFDLTKFDTCEEAMFAPGADMIVKALAGEDKPVRVTFECDGQRMEYIQDPTKVSGTINGTAFEIARRDEGPKATYQGDTPAGKMAATSTDIDGGINIRGQAGTVQYNHSLFEGKPGSDVLAEVSGKFG
jgi:hypothetical protein